VAFRVIQGAAARSCSRPRSRSSCRRSSCANAARRWRSSSASPAGLTAIGPILGGYLTEWTWRAIFWVNIPVALIALVLIAISKPVTEHKAGAHGLPRPRADRRGRRAQRVRLPAVGDLGLGQSGHRRCASPSAPRSWSSSTSWRAAPVAADAGEHLRDPRVPRREPRAGHQRCWCSSRCSSSPASTRRSRSASRPRRPAVLLYFFIGFVIAAQIGGRMLDRVGAKRPVVLGCALAAVGFYLWASKVTGLTSAPSSGTSSSPGPAWASCSARPAPTPSTAPPGSPTARPPASPRRCATTPPASAWRSSAPSSSPRPARTSSQLAARERRPQPRAHAVRVAALQSIGQRQPRLDPPLRPARLRLRHALRVLRDGRDHGGSAAIVALIGLRHGVQEEPPAHERDVGDPDVEQATLA
jgi:uncharacterized membrane protein YfcA